MTEALLRYPMANPSALEPPAEWATLRQQCPVARVTLPSGDEATLLTRYDDVKQVLSDPRFSRMLSAEGAARVSTSESSDVFNTSLMSVPVTPEYHQQWRRAVGRWFTGKRMAALRPGIEAMAERLVDEMVAAGPPADLKASLGFPLPVWVICDMLGVPDADRDRFPAWSGTLLNLTRYTQAEIDAAQAEFVEYLAVHVAAKRAAPGDDLLSELMDDMSDVELIGTGIGLLVAGHETTANMIGKMAGMLLADPGRWDRLVADRSLVRTAVEEILRYDANPGFGMPRYLEDEVVIGDAVLPPGTTVVCSLGAANRDDAAFDRAGELDLGRSPNPHLAFGVGPHSCLGQALARVELQSVLDVLLRRLPGLRLDVPVAQLRQVDGLVVGGLRDVPVRW